MKVAYYKMETVIHKKIIDVDGIEDMDLDNIRKTAKLHAELHGWDDIFPAETEDWAQEVIENDELPAKNPLHY